MSDKIVLSCEKLAKTYQDGKLEVPVFHDLNCQIAQGEQVAIIGASGAGKSTLLHLLGGLDKPTSGQVFVDNTDLNMLSETKISKLRNQKLGFIYQLHHLLPEFTVLENVCMPLLLNTLPIAEIKHGAIKLLERVGLGGRASHKIGELSGGERQRTAVVRALIHQPLCVLADEPTGNLDQKTASTVYDLIREINRELGTSFVIVTHDQRLADQMDRVLSLENGKLL